MACFAPTYKGFISKWDVQGAVRQALRDRLLHAARASVRAVVAEEAVAVVRAGAGVRTGRVLAAVVLLAVAEVHRVDRLLAGVSGPAH